MPKCSIVIPQKGNDKMTRDLVNSLRVWESGAQIVVIHDHHLGFRGTLAHLRDEAVLKARALTAEALIAVGRHVAPEEKVVRQVFDFRPITRFGGAGPLGDRVQPLPYKVGERRFRFAQTIEAMETQVVRAALHVGRADLAIHRV